jgi:hypothetical protein
MTDETLASIVDMRRLPLGMIDVHDARYQLRPEAIESVFYMVSIYELSTPR